MVDKFQLILRSYTCAAKGCATTRRRSNCKLFFFKKVGSFFIVKCSFMVLQGYENSFVFPSFFEMLGDAMKGL
jgi:hypothetical protein